MNILPHYRDKRPENPSRRVPPTAMSTSRHFAAAIFLLPTPLIVTLISPRRDISTERSSPIPRSRFCAKRRATGLHNWLIVRHLFFRHCATIMCTFSVLVFHDDYIKVSLFRIVFGYEVEGVGEWWVEAWDIVSRVMNYLSEMDESYGYAWLHYECKQIL